MSASEAPEPAVGPLRWLVGATTVGALAGLGVTGVLGVGVVLAAMALAVGFAAAATRRTAASDSAAQGVVLVAVLLVGAVTARHAVALPGSAVRMGAAPVAAALAATQPLLWRGVRDLATGAILAAGLVVVCCAAVPTPLDALLVVPEWGLLLVTARYVREARTRAGHPLATISGGRRPAIGAGAVALAIVGGLAVALVVPVPDHPRIAGGAALGSGGGTGVRAAGGFNGDRMSLLARGPLSSAPVLAVPGDTPALWRAQVFAAYDGEGWVAAGGGAGLLRPWPVTPTTAWARWSSPYVAASAGDTQAAVVRLDPADPTVYAPGDVVAVRAPSGVVASGSVGVVRLATNWSAASASAYVVRWRRQAAHGDAAVPPGPARGDLADPTWRDLPPELPDRVRALARTITAAAVSRAGAVAAIERWLRGHAVYTLDAPLPPPGADAVDDFLFRTRAGFCEHFASAEAVLLRALGVPARVATGLAYGSPLGDGRRGYAWKDAHAWVEVYYPGAGWVVSDPTAGVPLAKASDTTGGLTAALRSVGALLTRLPGGRPTLAAALLVLAGAAVMLWGAVGGRARRLAAAASRLRLRRRVTARPPPRAAEPSPAQLAYARLQERLRAIDAERRPHETVRDLRVRLAGARSDRGEVAAAFAALEAEWYGGEPYDAERSRAAAAQLDGLAPT